MGPFKEVFMETEVTLRAELKRIESQCAFWRGTSDGSYERALSDAGWWDVWDKLKRITNGENNTSSGRNEH